MSIMARAISGIKQWFTGSTLVGRVFVLTAIGAAAPILVMSFMYGARERDYLRNEADLNLIRTGKLIADMAADPLWNLSAEPLEAPIKELFEDGKFVGVTIYRDNGKIFHEAKPEVVDADDTVTEKEFEIRHRDAVIGKVVLRHSYRHIERRMTETNIAIAFGALATLLVCLFTVVGLLRKYVVAKIRQLSADARKLAEGNAATPFHQWRSADEISQLSRDLETTRQSLQFHFNELQVKNASLRKLNARLEEEVAQRSQQLVHAARLASLGEMAGGIAHEINNPITIIHGNTTLLVKKIAKNEFTAEIAMGYLRKILQTTERITKIVKGLRQISRSSDGEQITPVSLDSVVTDSLELCSERFRNNGVKLEVAAVPAITIHCRPVQISQVILNLLNNAFDAVQENEEKWVRLEFEDTPEKFILRVTDSGKGIPEAVAVKLFQPFFTTKEPGKGTGLGLSISRGIIEAHQGKFSLNRDCPNTQFVIEIPHPVAAAAPQAA